MTRQLVYLYDEPKQRIHKAVRNGTRGRDIQTYGRCQIYPMYLDNYKVLTTLFPLIGDAEEVLPPLKLCKHCWTKISN